MKLGKQLPAVEGDGENVAVQVVLSDARDRGLDELHERAASVLSQDLDLCDVPVEGEAVHRLGEHVEQNLSLPPLGAPRLEASVLWPSPETSQNINNY